MTLGEMQKEIGSLQHRVGRLKYARDFVNADDVREQVDELIKELSDEAYSLEKRLLLITIAERSLDAGRGNTLAHPATWIGSLRELEERRRATLEVRR